MGAEVVEGRGALKGEGFGVNVLDIREEGIFGRQRHAGTYRVPCQQGGVDS